MASYRQQSSGHWQARVSVPGGKTIARTLPTRAEAAMWAEAAEQAMRLGFVQNPREFGIRHTLDGLDIHIPDGILTMDMADEAESAVRAIVVRHAGS